METAGRLLTQNWDLYDTRHVVYQTKKISAEALEAGYHRAYRDFYSWSNIFRSSMHHDAIKHILKHFFYTAGWKKFEGVWNFLIKTGQLSHMLPVLEAVLSNIQPKQRLPEAKVEKMIPLPVNDHPLRA